MQIIRESFSTESHQQIEETKGRNNNLLALCNHENFKQIKQQRLPHPRTMGKWVAYFIHEVSKFLSKTAAYQDKIIELHL